MHSWLFKKKNFYGFNMWQTVHFYEYENKKKNIRKIKYNLYIFKISMYYNFAPK